MSKILGIILIVVVVALLIWQVVGIINDIRARFSKRNKSKTDSNESDKNISKDNKL